MLKQLIDELGILEAHFSLLHHQVFQELHRDEWKCGIQELLAEEAKHVLDLDLC